MPKSRRHISSRAMRAASLLVAAAALGVLLTSCEDFPFQTREAVPPTTVGDSPNPPLTTAVVFSNLILSVNMRNPVFYSENFAENLVFKPDPSDSIEVEKDFPGAYANWTLDVEAGVTEYMLDPVRCKFANLQFQNEIIVDETDSTAIIQEDYVLIVAYETVVEYKGSARFSMRKLPDGYWYIERWIDYLNVDQALSWGRLKGETRARM